MDETLIREYLAAYRAANPDKPEPSISYRYGWYDVTDGLPVGKYRKPQLIEMRDRLRRRAAESARARAAVSTTIHTD